MRLFDSKSKTKIELNPDKNGVLNIYLCGPTVYDDAHLGHARSAVCFDLLRRTLLAMGFCVNFARNYTDIDDKILNKMKEKNSTLQALTEHYISSYERDMKALNVLEPNFKPKATEYISQMIELIAKLENMGFTYALNDGIYFDSSKDRGYFSLSRRVSNDNQSRLERGVAKRNESDFVLWKFDENFYPAPFGKGRPGWHSECVAMINALFSELHIHCGGADLLFPHHENEAAQHRCACGSELARIWLHNGFVKIDGEKMSKSLNNSFFVRDALCEFNGEVLRFYLLQTHYRGDFNYALSDLEAAKKRLDKLYRLKNRLPQPPDKKTKRTKDLELNRITKKYLSNEDINKILKFLSGGSNISIALKRLDEHLDEFMTHPNSSQLYDILRFEFVDKFGYKIDKKMREKICLELKRYKYINEILEILGDDLNVSVALKHLDEFIMSANSQLDKFLKFKTWDKFVELQDEREYKEYKKMQEEIWLEFKQFTLIFGVGFLDPTKYFQSGVDAKFKAQIEAQIAQRDEAKKAKNFALADAIRKELEQKNIILQDKSNGETIWEIKK